MTEMTEKNEFEQYAVEPKKSENEFEQYAVSDDDFIDLAGLFNVKPKRTIYDEWKDIGVDIPKPIQEYITNPLYHFGNQAAMNLPREIEHLKGQKYPEPETAIGSALTYGAGAAGAVLGAGGKLLRAGIRPIVKSISATHGAGLGKAALRGGIAGAISSALYTPEQKEEAKGFIDGVAKIVDPLDRLAQGTLGFLTGSVVGVGAYGMTKYVRNSMAIKQKKARLEQIENFEATNPSDRIKLKQDIAKQKYDLIKDDIKIQELKIKATLDNNNKVLMSKVQEVAKGKTQDFKNVIKDYSRSVSDSYDEAISGLSEDVGNKIKKSDIAAFKKQFLESIKQDTDLKDTNGYKLVKQWFKKFINKDFEKKLANGNAEDKSIDFNNLNSARKALMSKQKYDGSFTNRDLAVLDRFRDEFANFVDGFTTDNSFASIQKEFAPQLKMKSFLGKFASPNDAMKTKNIYKTLVKYGSNQKLDGDETIFMESMKQIAKSNDVELDDLVNQFKKLLAEKQSLPLTKANLESEARQAFEKRSNVTTKTLSKIQQIKEEAGSLRRDISERTAWRKNTKSAVMRAGAGAITYAAVTGAIYLLLKRE
jgi:hypothetical protein